MSDSKPLPKVLTTGQVARVFKVAPRTVSKWYDNGTLKGYRLPPPGHDRRVPRFEFLRLLIDTVGESYAREYIEEAGWLMPEE